MKSKSAGPTLRAMASASINRFLIQHMHDGSASPLGRHYSEGTFDEDLGGIRVLTINTVTRRDPDEYATSNLTCRLVHPLWDITFTDRRQLTDDWEFERVAPHAISIEGDILDAARFLGIPRELFFAALRADGWKVAEITIERLRWIDMPYIVDTANRGVMMRFI